MTDQQPAPAGQAPAPLPPELVTAILRDEGSPYYPSQITVFCDHCGTEDTGDYMVREDMPRPERLAVARKHLVETKGWEHDEDGDDFCPVHASTDAAPHSESYIEPANRPAAWADMAAGLQRDGHTTTEIARSLCIDEATVVLLLAEATT